MKAVIYARYSSEKQDEYSIEGQLYDCYEYAKKKKLNKQEKKGMVNND